jgi:uracil-DNA glycosylase
LVRPSYDPEAYGAKCQICPLRSKRAVPPEGPPDPDLVIVGEAPGYQEEAKGRPFIGPSGNFLNDALRQIGANRSRVWITNTLLCRAEVPGMQGKGAFDLDAYFAWLGKENKERRKKAKGQSTPPDLIASPLECCKPRLDAEIARAEAAARQRGDPNGIVIVPMGNYALKALTGEEGILKWRGSVIQEGDKERAL